MSGIPAVKPDIGGLDIGSEMFTRLAMTDPAMCMDFIGIFRPVRYDGKC
jgi:hypothetical protein